ncbi:hypothetical protein [Chamaesiphon sp.]|uniref:hypothetical protein n=1 Tax=Chamaesiphon sp. TaxID=2814140 RepID=UPI003593EAF9
MTVSEILASVRKNLEFDWSLHISADDLWDATSSMPEDDADRLLIEWLLDFERST